MGFALWMDNQVAWAQGVHEYRPMGVAVISVTDLFRPRDFRFGPPAPRRGTSDYVGLFASLVEVNAHLTRRRSQASAAIPRRTRSPVPPWI